MAILDIDGEAADRVAALVRDTGRRAIAIAGDVMDRDAVRAAIDRTVAELGGLDILVNNAAGTRPIRLIDITDRQADRQIDINLKNLVASTQAAAKAMIADGRGGAIVNIASIEAMRAYIPLGRAGNYDDCAGVAVFLVSSMAAYVTGVTISVDGGTWASSGWTRDDAGGWKLFG